VGYELAWWGREPLGHMMARRDREKGNVMHKPDHLLEFEVREEFEWDPKLDDSRIIVKAEDGVISLSGAKALARKATLAGSRGPRWPQASGLGVRGRRRPAGQGP
jgi:hypothetical protein